MSRLNLLDGMPNLIPNSTDVHPFDSVVAAARVNGRRGGLGSICDLTTGKRKSDATAGRGSVTTGVAESYTRTMPSPRRGGCRLFSDVEQ